MDSIFVYGSLMRSLGDLIDQFLPGTKYIEKAKIPGKIYLVGDYPGLVIEKGGNSVYGEILSLPENYSFSMLDEYEDYHSSSPEKSEFVRVMINATGLETGKEYQSWVYIFNFPVGPFSEIKNGKFVPPKDPNN